LVEGFHHVHERVFAVKEPGQYVECVYWKGRATASLPKQELRRLKSNGADTRSDRQRRAWLGLETPTETPVYLGPSLSAGQRVAGPAIVEEPTTTIVVHPGWSLSVTPKGDYLLERRPERTAP
jgi:N-methylhydantoinase A